MLSRGLVLLLLAAMGQASGTHLDPIDLPRECASCHVGHGRPGKALLPGSRSDGCLSCHGTEADVERAREGGGLARSAVPPLIGRSLARGTRHPVEDSDAHSAAEALPETNPSTARHAECVDCHDPHAGIPPLPSAGGPKRHPFRGGTYEYELCARCHASSANLPPVERSKSEELGRGAVSSHPVEHAAGRAGPSLSPDYSAASVIACTDCHRSDDPSDPPGPHGSSQPYLLAAPYAMDDGRPEGDATYGLCYRCHRRESLLGDESFPSHRRHVVDAQISCGSCHDSHGSLRSPGLIRFNKAPLWTPVSPDPQGRMEYRSLGGGRGACFLSCHGVVHQGEDIARGSLTVPGGNLPPGFRPSAPPPPPGLPPPPLPR